MNTLAFLKRSRRSVSGDENCMRKHTRAYPVLFLLIFFLLSNTAPAQYQVINVPELKQKIRETKADSTRMRLYNILAWELRFADHKESERLADEVIRMASVSNDYLRLAEAYKIKGFARIVEQSPEKSLDMYRIALDYADKANSGHVKSFVMGLIGGMYNDKGDYDKAISYYLQSVKIAEEYGDVEMTAFLSNCLAETYSDAGRPISVTLPLYQKALKIEIAMENWQYVGMIWSNIAKDYMLSGNKTEAEKAAEQSIVYLHKKADRAYVYATVTTDIGEMYLGLGKFAEAEKYLAEALVILDSLKTKDNVLIPLSALAKLYVKTNDVEKAETSAKRLLQLAKAFKTKLFLRDGYKVLSDIAKKRNQPALALQYYDQYIKWNDSVFNENKEKSIADIESRIKLEQKELEVKYETQKKSQENLELKRSILGLRYKTVGIIIIAVLLLTLGIALIVLNRTQKRKNEELMRQKRIIEKQSGEKDTLIREINHRVKNNLQVISSLLNLQANSLTDEGAIEALRDSHKRVKAISLIHQKLYGSENIASVPLEEYIKALFSDLKMMYAAKQVQLVCTIEPAGFYLDIESAVPVGLILNETITNVFKYAFPDNNAGMVFIDFRENGDDTYILDIQDNGIGLPEGFDPERSSSLGFRIIKELSKQLRGQFRYVTGRGTVFTIHFPGSYTRNQMG
jgi:two-component sensor histidine kinase